MRTLLLIVMFVVSPMIAKAANLSFTWTPNTEEALAGYKIYYGPASREYSGFIDVNLPVITDSKVVATVTIPWGNKFFAATAYDKDGLESDYSNEVTAAVPLDAPTNLDVSAITVTFTPRTAIEKLPVR